MRGLDRERSNVAQNDIPVKASTQARTLRKTADQSFVLKFLSITCDPSEHSSFKKSLQSQTTLDGVPWSIKGHLISVLQDHMLTVTAKLDPYTGYLKVEEYISTSFQSATRGDCTKWKNSS